MNISYEYNFKKVSNEPNIYSNFEFSENTGPKNDIDTNSPLSIFHMIFTPDLVQLILRESNIYAASKGCSLNLELDEFKAFVGILIIMGFHQLPSLRLYWSTDINVKVDRVANVMTQKRFLQILRYLHLNDNSKMPNRNDPNFDKLYKVRPMSKF